MNTLQSQEQVQCGDMWRRQNISHSDPCLNRRELGFLEPTQIEVKCKNVLRWSTVVQWEGQGAGNRNFLDVRLIHAEPGSFLRQIWATSISGCHPGPGYLLQIYPEGLGLFSFHYTLWVAPFPRFVLQDYIKWRVRGWRDRSSVRRIWFPALTSSSSQPAVILPPGNLTPSSWSCQDLHPCAHTHTQTCIYTQVKSNKNNV